MLLVKKTNLVPLPKYSVYAKARKFSKCSQHRRFCAVKFCFQR